MENSTGKESLPGRMDRSTMDSTKKEKSTEMEGSHTLPRKYTMENGLMESKRAKGGFMVKQEI